MEQKRQPLPENPTTMPQVLNIQTNQILPLSSIWNDRKCIVCFLRHFNCRFCQQQFADLNRIYAYINTQHNNKLKQQQQNGKISVIAIGVSATAEEAKQFKASNQFLGELYIDYTSSQLATTGHKSGQFNYNTTAPSYDIFRLYDNKSNIYNASGTSLRSEVVALADAALNKGFTDGDMSVLSSKPKQLFRRVGGMFVLGPGNHCDYAYRSQYAGDHPLINDVLQAAIGADIDDNDAKTLTAYVYPSTAKWVKDLKVTKKSMQNKDEMDAKYLQTLRNEQEQRFNSVYINHFCNYWTLCAIVVIISISIAYYNTDYISYVVILIVIPAIIMFVIIIINKNKNVHDDINVKLLTLKDIDELALKMGNIKCDCGFVQQQDVSNKSENIKDVETRLRSISSPKISATNVNIQSNTTAKQLKSYLETCCYLREFLGKPHPLVGRKGPVCPFVPGSLRMDAMYLAVVNINKSHDMNRKFRQVENVARSFINRFHVLQPSTGRKAAYKAVVLIFPDIELSEAHDIIDKVQLKLKLEFVSKGLMIGEFHRNNNSCGLRNENFYPLRTPIPSLAIRCIVPTDLVFLSPSKYEASLRVKFLKSYLKQFVNDKSKTAKQAVKQANELLKKAENEI